jgi:phage baseplate assembly protein W|tara:strand:- start:4747 stop:5154 length:408 start_codon:yes stop_codon:yes gene_type:complete
MPIIQSKRKINPLSINSNISIGVAFPLDDVNLFSGTQTVKEQVKSNLLNLLLTEKGERINQPDFGIGLKNLLFEQNIDEDNLSESITNQMGIFIPEISLLDTKVELIADENLLYIKITYQYNLDGSDDSIQLNFN